MRKPNRCEKNLPFGIVCCPTLSPAVSSFCSPLVFVFFGFGSGSNLLGEKAKGGMSDA
jgi:hypothetical protein